MQEVSRVLFVCMGNICRSPTAEGIFRQLVQEARFDKEIEVDSAGTHTYHLGQPPDPRAVKAANSRGVNIANLVARAVSRSDFLRFHYIVAMDRNNLVALDKIRPNNDWPRPQLLLEYTSEIGEVEIPDPYHGTLDDYYRTFELIYAGSKGLIEEIKRVRN